MKTILGLALGFALIFTFCAASRADDDDKPASDAAGAKIAETPEFKGFLDAYIASRKSGKWENVEALFDPASRALLEKTLAEDKEDASLFKGLMMSPIPAKHQIAVMAVAPETLAALEKQAGSFATKPEFLAKLSYSMDANTSCTEEIYLAKSGGKWFQAFCPFPKPNEGETAATAVSVSAISDYTYNPKPMDETDHVYTWEVQLNAADSKSGPFEIDEITYGDGSSPQSGEAKNLVGSDMAKPNDSGFVDFELGIGGKKPPQPFGRGVNMPFNFRGHGTGTFAAFFVDLPGAKIDKTTPSPKGTQMANGQLLLMRYNVTDDDGAKYVVDVVLRHPAAAAPAAAPLTVADAQKQAMAKYPDLAKAGTPLHTKFLDLYNEAKAKNALSDPSWPLLLALRASSLLASGTAPVWYKLESSETYICDFELQPDESRNIDIPATKDLVVGFDTNMTMKQSEQIGELKDFSKHLPKIANRNGSNYVGSAFGGTIGISPSDNLAQLRATNKSSYPLKFVIYIKLHQMD